MQAIKALALLFSMVIASQAHAYKYKTLSDRTELEFPGILDPDLEPAWPEDLGALVQKPLVLFFTSPGGDIDRIRSVVNKLREIAKTAKETSGVIPTIVVRDECSSACIPILSAFNQMARENLVHLLVDRTTEIGFHGCSDVDRITKEERFSEKGTKRYLGYLAEQGGRPEWIETNTDLFQSPKITPFKPEDRRLQDSGILSNAEIVDLHSFRITYIQALVTQASN